jgi:hypothetical protein
MCFALDAGERERAERVIEAAGAVIEARTEFTSYARDPEGNRVAISHYERDDCDAAFHKR